MQDDIRRRLIDGDPSALAELLDRHWAGLVAYVERLGEDPDGAEDIAQDAFARLWRTRSRLASQGSLEALLFRMARNAHVDLARRRRVRRDWVADRRAASPVPTVHDPALAREVELAVRRAIAGLTPERREVFLLLRTTSMSHRAVAEILGIAPQTVANLMTRAMADLREALAPFLSDE